MHHRSTIVVALSAALTSTALAVDLHVPGGFPTIQDAIDAAVDGDVVIIEPGTYHETIDFLNKEIVVTSVDEDPTSVTIDAGGAGTCVTMNPVPGLYETKLIGVTVTGGDNAASGGGIDVSGFAHIRNCIVRDNVANNGAGIRAYGGVEIVQCIITDNSTYGGGGVAVYCSDVAQPRIANCVVVDNDVPAGQSAIHSLSTNLLLSSTIVYGNGDGVSFTHGGGAPILRYSLIEGGWAGFEILDEDPMFVDLAGNDFRLQPGSPCIDSGTNIALPADLTEDLEGSVRRRHDPYSTEGAITLPRVDMGVYEYDSGVRYVDVNAAGAGDGLIWDDAYTDLNLAMSGLYNDPSAKEIWVADGVYKPDFGTGDPWSSFVLRDGLAIMGGWDGGEIFAHERDVDSYRPVLSGDLGGANSYHVMRGQDVDQTAVVDGFVIEHGIADGTTGEGGGGLLLINASPSFNDVIFRENEATVAIGSAVSARGGGHASFVRCGFLRNSGTGAAVVFDGADATFVNCVVAGNVGLQQPQAGMHFRDGATIEMTNCTVYANESVNVGAWQAGVGLFQAALTVTNTIIWANVADGSSSSTANFWASSSTVDRTYTTIQGSGLPVSGNNDTDPAFVDMLGPDGLAGTDDDDISLLPDSHAIDSGLDSAIAAYDVDYAGNARTYDDAGIPNTAGNIVDRGAVEATVTSCAFDCNGDGAVDVSDLLTILAGWGASGIACEYLPSGGDGVVDVSELLAILAMWGDCP